MLDSIFNVDKHRECDRNTSSAKILRNALVSVSSGLLELELRPSLFDRSIGRSLT